MQELKAYLNSNIKIEIEKLLPNKKIKKYKTAFYHELDNEIHFFRPSENNTLVDFIDNETIRFLVYTKEGIFAFKTKVLRCSSKLLRVEFPKTYTKIQRRGLLRVEIPLFATVQYEKNNELKRQELKILNISGSGISFNIDDDLKDAEELIVAFKMDEKIIEANVRIVEIRKNKKENVPKYRISAQFISLNNHEIEYIIKHCIKYQIKTLKKF